MFSKGSSKARQADQAPRADGGVKSVPSIISGDLTVDGNLSSNGEIQVDGTVRGDIACKALIVGVKGSVMGEVTAQTVRLHGNLSGQVRAKSVFLASTANMSGDIEHESLAIEPGAFMEGHCRRIAETRAIDAAPHAAASAEKDEVSTGKKASLGAPEPAAVAS